MAGGINFGQALSLLGGVPVQPAGAKTIIEKLRAAKSMIPGDMGGIMSMVMSQGPGALLKNPLGQISSLMQGQMSGMLGKLGSLENGPAGLISAIGGAGGLTQAMGSLQGLTNSLSGLSGGGLMQLVGHANTLSMFGNSVPSGIGLDIVTKPLLMQPRVSQMLGVLEEIEAAIDDNDLDEVAAVAEVAAMTAEITAVVDASNNALATVQAAALTLAQSAAAISLIASGPPELAPIVNLIVRDEHKEAIQEAMDEQIRA